MEDEWSAKIKRLDNGFILTMADPENTRTRLFEIRDSNCDKSEARLMELKTVRCLFQELMEHFGVFNSKHNKHNMWLEIVSDEE